MVELKPMDIGEILDGGMTIYRRHFGLLLRFAVIALWLPLSLNIYVEISGGPQQHIGMYLLFYLTQYFGALFLTAGAVAIISDSYLGTRPTLGHAMSVGAGKILPLWGVGLGKGLLVGLIVGVATVIASALLPLFIRGGGVVGVVFGLAALLGVFGLAAFVLCGYAVTTQVVVLEPLDGAFDSFGRSWELTKGFKWKVFSIGLIVFIILYAPIFALGFAVGLMRVSDPQTSATLAVISALIPIVLTPLLACVFTLMYYDLRIRREGFDLQVLSQQLVSS